jgi:chitin disaccharide deacetylase
MNARFLVLFATFALGVSLETNSFAQQQSAQRPAWEIKLLIRGDDMGSFHAANMACIESYTNGILKSAELIVPAPCFSEAVKLIKDNPGLDVGVHPVLTSEWDALKWGPKTVVPSLVDANGYFFPMVWKNPRFAPRSSIQEAQWRLDEVERELRAQIETALWNVPRVSHLSGHMGFESLDPRIAELVNRLRREYRLLQAFAEAGLKSFPGWGTERGSVDARIRAFIANLEKLSPGTYIFVEHPALSTSEMQPIGHTGYENVGVDRDAVTRVFTSPEVRGAIKRLGIKLITYSDLR